MIFKIIESGLPDMWAMTVREADVYLQSKGLTGNKLQMSAIPRPCCGEMAQGMTIKGHAGGVAVIRLEWHADDCRARPDVTP